MLNSCINRKCIDPCPGYCGSGAVCTVISHVPSCSCPSGYIGNPFNKCSPKTTIEESKARIIYGLIGIVSIMIKKSVLYKIRFFL